MTLMQLQKNGGMGQYGSTRHDVTVRNNIFRDNIGPGIQISNEDQQPYGYVLESNVSRGSLYGIYIFISGILACRVSPRRVSYACQTMTFQVTQYKTCGSCRGNVRRRIHAAERVHPKKGT